MLAADGTSVGAHTMIRAISVVYHLVDVTVAINHVVRRNFPRIGSLKSASALASGPVVPGGGVGTNSTSISGFGDQPA